MSILSARRWRSSLPFVMQPAPPHVGLDAVGRGGADRRVVAVADGEIVLHQPAEAVEGECHAIDRLAVRGLDGDGQAVLDDRQMKPIGPPVVAERREVVLLEQIEDGDGPLMFHLRAAANHRVLVE